MPQNFCHTHTDTQAHRLTDTQAHIETDIFQKYSNSVQDIPKRVNPSKTEIENLHETYTFFYLYRRKVKRQIKKIEIFILRPNRGCFPRIDGNP